MRLERGGGRERGREREGGGTREVVGRGKAETGRDREGEGDVVLLVAFIVVLPVAFIALRLRCAVRTVAWMVLLAVVLKVWIVDGSAVVGLTLALETTAALLVLSIVVFAVVFTLTSSCILH